MPLRSRIRRVSTTRLLGLALLALVVLLYYRPLSAYFSTRHALDQRRAEVGSLATQNKRLEHRLAAANTLTVLEREARRLGYVKAGEHLYIVKGIAEWRRHLRATLRGNG